MPTDADKR